MNAYDPRGYTHSIPLPVPFGDTAFTANNLRHWFDRHCRSQNPSDRQYREDHRRLFGATVIDPLGRPFGDDHCRDAHATQPFVTLAGRLIADAVQRGQYLTYDEHAASGEFQHRAAVVLTQPGWVAVLRALPECWHFWTAFFTHSSNLERPSPRGSAGRLLAFYTDGAFGVPAQDLRVNGGVGTGYRTHISFPNPEVWGERLGRFDVRRIPTWCPAW